ncbi:tetratricopeptide repeat protein [Thalassospira sp. MA62]|nr:tetratricopeptide repeat protein [Thalassospira sp. MA62]
MNAMSFSEMGLAALQRRQFDAAVNMLRQALGEDMDNLAARFGLARALHEKGSITEALGEYRTVLQSDGGHEECLYHIARALLENGDARDGLNHIDIILRSQPTDPDLLTLRGQILIALEQTERALTSLQTAAHHNPGSEKIHSLIAQCYRNNQDMDGERRALEQWLRINPGSLSASNDMGVISLREGHLIAAFETFEQILAQDPNHPEASVNRAITLTIMGGVMDHDAIWGRVMEVAGDLDDIETIRACADQVAALDSRTRKGTPEAIELTNHAVSTKIDI